MLVLSRKFNEKLVLPLIETTIQIVSVKPGVVRIGVDAPERVKVLREEVAKAKGLLHSDQGAAILTREEKHAIFNQLNTVNLAATMLRGFIEQRLEGEQADTVGTILDRLLNASEEILEILKGAVDSMKTKPEKSAGAEAPPASQAAEKPRRRVKRALLVEDDSNERELLAGLLRMRGFEVVTAGDGTDALDHLAKGPYDVALIDMMLPVKDGLSTIREIRGDAAFDRMKIYAMTGHTRSEFQLDPNGDGIDRWLSKPLNPQELMRDLDASLAS